LFRHGAVRNRRGFRPFSTADWIGSNRSATTVPGTSSRIYAKRFLQRKRCRFSVGDWPQRNPRNGCSGGRKTRAVTPWVLERNLTRGDSHRLSSSPKPSLGFLPPEVKKMPKLSILRGIFPNSPYPSLNSVRTPYFFLLSCSHPAAPGPRPPLHRATSPLPVQPAGQQQRARPAGPARAQV